MYALLWLKDYVRYKQTVYVNVSEIHCFLCSDDKELDRRLIFQFAPVDFVGESTDSVKKSIRTNWYNFGKELKKECGNQEITVVLPFSSVARDFSKMSQYIVGSSFIKEVKNLSVSGSISYGTFVMEDSGAENLWKMYQIFRGTDIKSAEITSKNRYVSSNEIVIRSIVDSRKRMINNHFEYMLEQIDEIAKQLGYYVKNRDGTLLVLTACNTYSIELANRPMQLCSINPNGSYSLIDSQVYSPVDAMTMIFNRDKEEISRKLAELSIKI